MPNTLAGVNRLTDAQAQELVGQTVEVKLETLQQDKGYYVVSRRKHLNSLIPEKLEQIKKDLETDPYKGYIGTITGSRDFGLFVEFEDCLTGMIHKSNINPAFKDTFQNIPEGTQIEFYVKDIIKNNKIILTQVYNVSLWDTIEVGQKLDGTVIDVKSLGAIIRLDDETVGLIQTMYIDNSNKKLLPGDKVNVKVISVIRNNRKIYLDIVK
jgi:predicted RNA-binding protein with RPS1 domain